MRKGFVFDDLTRASQKTRHRREAKRKLLAPRPRSVLFESLESRLLLSADISGSMALSVLPDIVLPTDSASAALTVKNSGTTTISQAIKVNVYASLNGTLDSGDILLGTANSTSTNFSPGQSKSVAVALTVPNTIAPGSYQLLAAIDADNRIAEGNEANNVVAGEGFSLAWKFGDIPGRSDEAVLKLGDTDGTVVSFALDGVGTGEVTRDGADWDLAVSGTDASSVLRISTDSGGNGRVKIDDIHVFGALGAIAAPTTDLTGTLAVDGPLTAGLRLGGATNAVIAAPTILGTNLLGLTVPGIAILGGLKSSEIRIGATLGADGQPGGTGANADTYGAGKLGDLVIGGNVTLSYVRVGQDPVDGVFDNGDDALRGGSASVITSVVITGSLSNDSRVIAGSLPANAWVQNKQIPTANDVRFKTDVHGPDIALKLQNDTGASSSDGLTFDASVLGQVSDPSGISGLKAGFGSTPAFNILADLRADGSFLLTRARLEQIKGAALVDNIQTLTVLATDQKGNTLRSTLTFNLDTSAPSVSVDQAAAQSDPTNVAPINFTVRFSEAVSGFTGTDVSFAGSTVGGVLQASVTGNGANYGVSVTGMQGAGAVVASLVAGVAFDLAGNASRISTSIDNRVAFDNQAPTVTIDQVAGQADPAKMGPIVFAVQFSEVVSGFAADDVDLSASSLGNLSTTVTGSGASYLASVSGMQGEGAVVASVKIGAAQDAAGNASSASTSTDNIVAFDNENTAPVVNDQMFSVAENSANGTVVGTITASDPDLPANTLTYAVTGSPAFAVNSVTGEITVADSNLLDFETTPNFMLTATVMDNGAPALSDQAMITINLTNVTEATMSINDVTVTEGDSGTTDAIFTVTLAGATSLPVTVDFATAGGTATAGIDYVATSGTMTFAPGETSKSITVPVIGDMLLEDLEDVCREPHQRQRGHDRGWPRPGDHSRRP